MLILKPRIVEKKLVLADYVSVRALAFIEDKIQKVNEVRTTYAVTLHDYKSMGQTADARNPIH